MPHVVLQGDIDLDAFHRGFEPIEERRGDTVLKVTDCFASRRRPLLLLDCVVVDRRPKTFLMMVDGHRDRCTIRLFPPTDPEKCDGVRRLIARVGHEIRRRSPGARYGATNIEEFLIPDD